MILILVVQLLNVLYWGSKKEGYYIDELWTYGLTNSYEAPFLQEKEGYMNEWHEPEFYMNYLVVNEGEEFAFHSVYGNQVKDVHPPFYYMILHTVCSLFPESFSKWFGLAVNFLFFGGIIWLLYEIGGQLLGKENPARLLPPFIYGFSGGALSTVMYIRMYTMLTFWALLLVFLVFYAMGDKIENTGKKLWLFVGIGLTITAGFMTQYYFVIFAFFLSAAYVLFCLCHRKWKEAVAYAAAVWGGLGTGFFLFPASVSQIFLGQKGKDSMSNAFLGLGDFVKRLLQYSRILSKEFLVNSGGINILLMVMFFVGIMLLVEGGGTT